MIYERGHRVAVYGLQHGEAHVRLMVERGVDVAGAVELASYERARLGLPVWHSMREATAQGPVDFAIIYAPAPAVRSAALDAIEGGARRLVIVTSRVPQHDVLHLLAAAHECKVEVLGPGSPGVLVPGVGFVGALPADMEAMFKPGVVAVVSRSLSLGMLACQLLSGSGLGISVFIGLGDNPVLGLSLARAIETCESHEATLAIACLGIVGGAQEENAAATITRMRMPVAVYIAGNKVPEERRIGHLGAIVRDGLGGIARKRAALKPSGALLVDRLGDLPEILERALSSQSRGPRRRG